MQKELVASRAYASGLDIDLESEVIMANALEKKVRQPPTGLLSYVYHWIETWYTIFFFIKPFSCKAINHSLMSC